MKNGRELPDNATGEKLDRKVEVDRVAELQLKIAGLAREIDDLKASRQQFEEEKTLE